MAQTAARKRKYKAQVSTDGTLALKLDAGYAIPQPDVWDRPASRPRRKTKSKSKVVAMPRVAPSINVPAIMTVLGFVLVAVMMIGVLYSHVQLTEVSHDVVELKKEISALEAEQMTLNTRYELTFDFATVKKAAEISGMQKVTSGQVYYIDMTEEDVAVAYQEEESSLKKLFSSLGNGICAAVDFFR